ncbi:MAG: hypothetical protein HY021_13565 [Burkholderiales bacterium]|nr:hypothetical protein [Burkholderiales bacterium]
MKHWKGILGLGAACAACCALPVSMALLGTGALASVAAFVTACAGELALTAGLLAAAALGLGLWRWRQIARRPAACAYAPEAVAGASSCCQGSVPANP